MNNNAIVQIHPGPWLALFVSYNSNYKIALTNDGISFQQDYIFMKFFQEYLLCNILLSATETFFSRLPPSLYFSNHKINLLSYDKLMNNNCFKALLAKSTEKMNVSVFAFYITKIRLSRSMSNGTCIRILCTSLARKSSHRVFCNLLICAWRLTCPISRSIDQKFIFLSYLDWSVGDLKCC